MRYTDINQLQTPYWLLEEDKLLSNLKTIQHIKEKSGAKVLLALKGYALYQSFDIVSKYLDGCCASGLHEAILAYKSSKKRYIHTPLLSKKRVLKI